MKQRYILLILAPIVMFQGCKDDKEEDTPTPPHDITLYSYDEPSSGRALASVKYSGNVMRYCGATTEEGDPGPVKSVNFAIEGRNELIHYLFDEEGRLELAYTSLNGVNGSEVHKLEYGELDSVYYSVHQFNWDNGVNFLEYEVGFGKWSDEYLGTVLYAKEETQAIESANASLKLFADLSELVIENLEEENFSSIHSSVARQLSAMVIWSTPSITEEEGGEGDPFSCYLFDNNPNPNGTPGNPTGALDECFDTDMQVNVTFSTAGGGWFAVLDISGGAAPYVVSSNGGPFLPNGFFSHPAPELGLYTFEVMDSNGCTTTHIAVRENVCLSSDLAVSLTSTPGAAFAEPTGGTPPYQYRWFSGETLITTASGSSNFSEGTYTCIVTDAVLCETSAEIFVDGKCEGLTTIEDINGNVYPITEIGGQCWMAENLRATSLSSGASIPNVSTQSFWETTSFRARVAYDNDPSNVEVYGYLYNHRAVTSPEGLCPTGWHVPDLAEMQTLVSNTGGTQVAGLALKSTTLWADIDDGGPGNNSSGFNALPGGVRDGVNGLSSDFDFDEISGNFWTSELDGPQDAYYMNLSAGSHSAQIYWFGDLNDGHSVRCVKD